MVSIAGGQFFLLVSTSLWATIGLGAQPPRFSLQPLPSVPGGLTASVYGINRDGEAVGSVGGTSACPSGCAVIWRDAKPTLLALDANLESLGAEAVAINDAGQVVGNAKNIAGGFLHRLAIVWTGGVPSILPGPRLSQEDVTATSINNAGEVTGTAAGGSGYFFEPIVWNGQTPTVLDGQLGCEMDGSIANAINNGGTVVGYTACPGPGLDFHFLATIWHGTTAQQLSGGEPLAVNDSGLIVGGLVDLNFAWIGARAWVNGILESLKTLPNANVDDNSHATSVNNHGVIVGTTQMSNDTPPGPGTYHAIIWATVNSVPQDLNDLIDSSTAEQYLLSEAAGINDHCSIVVNGYARSDYSHGIAFLLTPIGPSVCTR